MSSPGEPEMTEHQLFLPEELVQVRGGAASKLPGDQGYRWTGRKFKRDFRKKVSCETVFRFPVHTFMSVTDLKRQREPLEHGGTKNKKHWDGTETEKD